MTTELESVRQQNEFLKGELLAAGRRNVQRWIVGLLIVGVILLVGLAVTTLQAQVISYQKAVVRGEGIAALQQGQISQGLVINREVAKGGFGTVNQRLTLIENKLHIVQK